MSPAARAALKGIPMAQNVAAKFICEDNEINGYPCNVSGCVSNDNIFFGDFDQLVAAFWGPGLEIIVYVQGSRIARAEGIAISPVSFVVTA